MSNVRRLENFVQRHRSQSKGVQSFCARRHLVAVHQAADKTLVHAGCALGSPHTTMPRHNRLHSGFERYQPPAHRVPHHSRIFSHRSAPAQAARYPRPPMPASTAAQNKIASIVVSFASFTSRLTLRSRGFTTGCALRSPLTLYVRRHAQSQPRSKNGPRAYTA